MKYVLHMKEAGSADFGGETYNLKVGANPIEAPAGVSALSFALHLQGALVAKVERLETVLDEQAQEKHDKAMAEVAVREDIAAQQAKEAIVDEAKAELARAEAAAKGAAKEAERIQRAAESATDALLDAEDLVEGAKARVATAEEFAAKEEPVVELPAPPIPTDEDKPPAGAVAGEEGKQ